MTRVDFVPAVGAQSDPLNKKKTQDMRLTKRIERFNGKQNFEMHSRWTSKLHGKYLTLRYIKHINLNE